MHKAQEDDEMVGLPDVQVALDGDVLVSQSYDDIYFQRDVGLEETSYVFLEGTELAQRLANAEHITIAETGFGTGLNFVAACALRDRVNPACQIDYISFELCPLPAEHITAAHKPYGDITAYSAALCAALPPRWPGYHKRILNEGKTHLHLYYGDAYQLLSHCDFAADIWFLDGFNPAKNPELWHDGLFDEIARCCTKGAMLATFTAAGIVKRGLRQAGFTLDVRKGFGRKREMITAQFGKRDRNVSPPSHKDKTALIIGGGIAGASLSYALSQRGIAATILEKESHIAAGASGNGAAMQSARLRVHNDAPGRLSVACLSYAKQLSEQANVIAHHGAITLNNRDKDQKRLDKLTISGWPDDLFQALDAAQASELIGIETERAGDYQPASAVIKPAVLTAYLSRNATIRTHCEVVKWRPLEQGHEVTLTSGERLVADYVYLANGASLPAFLAQNEFAEMDLQISAGQVSFWPSPIKLSQSPLGVNYGGYMTPAVEGYHYLGASFNRDGQSAVTQDGHHHNIALLPEEWRHLAPPVAQAGGRLSYRISTKDRMPICGFLEGQDDKSGNAASLPIICALGARGMTNAPLLADMLVAQSLDLPSGFDREIIQALRPHNHLKSKD